MRDEMHDEMKAIMRQVADIAAGLKGDSKARRLGTWPDAVLLALSELDGTITSMTDHECEFPYDESDLGREVTCHHGCGRRMKVVMVGEGDLALQHVG